MKAAPTSFYDRDKMLERFIPHTGDGKIILPGDQLWAPFLSRPCWVTVHRYSVVDVDKGCTMLPVEITEDGSMVEFGNRLFTTMVSDEYIRRAEMIAKAKALGFTVQYSQKIRGWIVCAPGITIAAITPYFEMGEGYSSADNAWSSIIDEPETRKMLDTSKDA